MPAGRGRKGERQSRSRRGKQTTSMVVPRNPLPSAPSIGTNECENYLDAAQLHELFLASCQPGVATHQAQLSKLYPAVYNPPGFPFYGGRFIIHTLTHHRSFPSGTPSSDLVYSTRPSAAAGAWHLGLSSYCYYLVALPKNVKKCYGCGDNFSEKFRQSPHNIVVKHFDRRVVRRDESRGALGHSADFSNTYYHPSPVHIMRKVPVFDGRVHVDLSTYHSLEEGQREMLKAFGLIVNIV